MAVAQSVAELIKPAKGTWRVVFARWGLYLLAILPGVLVLTRELDQSVGLRPYFQDLQLPLAVVDVRLLLAELSGGGTAILMLGVLVIWILQLVWLGGATHLFSSPGGQATNKVFRPGWQYLGRYVRIAVFALIVMAVAQMGIKYVFSLLSARAELEDWSFQTSIIDLNVWRVVLMFVVMTLIGVFAFWIRVIAAAESRRDLRRLPMAVLRLFLRRPASALLFQFAAITLVLALQAIALFCWRQSSGGWLWPALWAAMLLFAAWVWQLRVRVAVNVLKSG